MKNKSFRISKSSVASYDYIDYVSGQGYKTFYAAGTQYNGSPAEQYILTTKVINADVAAAYITISSEMTFDIPINNYMQVNDGTAYIEYTIVASGSVVLTFNVMKVRGGAETSLGSVTTATLDGTRRKAVKIAMTSMAFSDGDTLRLKVTPSSYSATATLYFDPASRFTFTETTTGATIGSDLKLNLPLKIDI